MSNEDKNSPWNPVTCLIASFICAKRNFIISWLSRFSLIIWFYDISYLPRRIIHQRWKYENMKIVLKVLNCQVSLTFNANYFPFLPKLSYIFLTREITSFSLVSNSSVASSPGRQSVVNIGICGLKGLGFQPFWCGFCTLVLNWVSF